MRLRWIQSIERFDLDRSLISQSRLDLGHALCDLTNEKSEWEFPDKGLLVVMNSTKSDLSRVKTMGLLDTGV